MMHLILKIKMSLKKTATPLLPQSGPETMHSNAHCETSVNPTVKQQQIPNVKQS